MPRLRLSTALRVGVLMAALALPVAVPGASRGASTFVVNTTDDLTDTSPGDGLCVTSLATCSLRAAIEEANALLGNDVVNFNIGGGGVQTITTASELPVITDPVTIDGSSQPGYAGMPLVEVRVSMIATTQAVHLTADNSAIRGLVLGGKILFVPPPASTPATLLIESASGTLLESTFIGTDATGTAASPFAVGWGIRVVDSSNTILRHNVISGNASSGIRILSSSGTRIVGNHIGTDLTGSIAVPNQVHGITFGGTSTDTAIGGIALSDRNVISGNLWDGITGTGTNTRIEGNYIGVNAGGTMPIPNGRHGVVMSAGVTLGGGTAAQRNIISGNGAFGVESGLSPGGTILGNYIGTDASGVMSVPNVAGGINLRGSFTIVGGTISEEGNLVAFNGGPGVRIQGGGALGSNNLVAGNVIRSNLTTGVLVDTGKFNRIVANAISGNGGLGIDLVNNGNFYLPAPVQTSPGAGTACAGCTIDVYGDAADEGQYYAGSTTADGAGNWSYPGPVLGAYITATATDADGNTSEFSNAILNPDTDGDGCSDAEELGVIPALGGNRNPANYWDFFNVTGDKTIDLSDALDILGYFGDPGTSAAANKRDRDNTGTAQPWQTIEANDGVDLTDVLVNLQSFGHDCSGPP